MSSTSVALLPNQKLSEWVATPEAKGKIGTALGSWMNDETFVAQMMIAFQREDLKDCTEASKFKAIHDCAALALLPSLQHVALLPRNCTVKVRGADGKVQMKQNGKPVTRDEWQCHIMPQWQGYQALMMRNPVVQDITATIVFVGETYRLINGGQDIEHEFDPFDDAREVSDDLKNVRGGYVRIKYNDDRIDKVHFVTKKQIEKSKACAKTSDIWGSWPTQMVLKTLMRDAYARRVVPIDTMNNIALERMKKIEDRTLQNKPNRHTRLSSLNDRPVTKSPAVTQLLDAAGAEVNQEPPVKDANAANETSAQETSDLLADFVAAIASERNQAKIKTLCKEAMAKTDDDDLKFEMSNAADGRIKELKQAA